MLLNLDVVCPTHMFPISLFSTDAKFAFSTAKDQTQERLDKVIIGFNDCKGDNASLKHSMSLRSIIHTGCGVTDTKGELELESSKKRKTPFSFTCVALEILIRNI